MLEKTMVFHKKIKAPVHRSTGHHLVRRKGRPMQPKKVMAAIKTAKGKEKRLTHWSKAWKLHWLKV